MSLATRSSPIRRVAVLGAGVMGSGIAAHCANAGIPVVLLDIVPPKLSEADRQSMIHLMIERGDLPENADAITTVA